LQRKHILGTSAVFLGSLAWLGLYLLAYWPGIYSYDTYNYLPALETEIRFVYTKEYSVYRSIVNRFIYTRESWLYGLAMQLASRLDFRLVPLHFLQILLAASVLGYFYFILHRRLERPFIACASIILLLAIPLNPLFAIYSDRDVLFSWLCALTLIQLIDLWATEALATNRLQTIRILFLCLTIVIAAALRKEAIFCACLLPIQIWFLTRKFRLAVSAVISTILLGSIFWILAPILYTGLAVQMHVGHNYNYNAFARPLFYILAHRGYPLTEQERTIIQPLSDPDQVSTVALEEGVDWSKLNFDATQKQIQSAIFLTLKLVVQRPDLFFQDRWQIFLRQFTLPKFRIYTPGDHEFEELTVQKKFRLSLESRMPSFYSFSEAFRAWVLGASQTLYLTLYGPAIGVFFLTIVLFCSPWRRVAAIVSILPASEFLVVFLFQPSAESKYIYFPFLASFFIFPILLSEKSHPRNHVFSKT